MQSETGFPSSHQLKFYVASKSRLKLAARAVLSADAGLVTRWLYCVECPQHNTRLEAPGYLCLLSNSVACAEAYLRSRWHLDPSNQFDTIYTNRELGAAVPRMGAELGSHATQCVWAKTFLCTK